MNEDIFLDYLGSSSTRNYSNNPTSQSQKLDMSSFDSVLTPEMGNFKARQSQMPMNSIQQQANYPGECNHVSTWNIF